MRRITLLLGLLWILGCGRSPVAIEPKPDEVEKPAASLTNSIGMKLALIPAGEFLMGSADSDPDGLADEKPQHRVRITRPFHMGVYEVTQEEYQRVMGSGSSFFSPQGHGKDKVAGLNTARFPVEQIRWPDAVEFCRRLSEQPAEKAAGRVYRLPTEAEWEYACRAGTTTPFHVGSSLSSLQANFNGNHPHGDAAKGPFLVRTTEVGSYTPNAFGLYDMHGNVWDWCADWHDRDYYQRSPLDDPPGPATGSMRVIRGGEWYAEGRDCRSAFRYADLPTGIFYVMGFRVVMTTTAGAAPAPPITTVAKADPPKPLTAPVGETTASAGEDWPQWRGPRRDGSWRGPTLPEKWPAAGLRLRWRQPIGGGYSGIAVAAGKVYTQDYRKGTPSPNPLPPGRGQGEGADETERILCFDAATGQPIWSHEYPVTYANVAYGNGPRATPTVAEGRVYVMGAVGHVFCLDAATGKRIWEKNLVTDAQAKVPGWGFAASPLLFEELVILHGGGADNCLIALDRRTGTEVWRNVPDAIGYASPILAKSHGQWQVVAWTQSNVRGLEPRTGKLLWTIPFEVTYGTAIADPVCHDDLVFVSSYYEGMKAIRLGPKAAEAAIDWEDRRNLCGVMSTPLCREGHGYLLDRRSGLVCFELKTGKKLWDDANRSTPKGRNPHASLAWLGDGDRALIFNSNGELILARLQPSGFQEQARAKVIGPTWAHPAFAGDCVYARDDAELVCFSLLPAGP